MPELKEVGEATPIRYRNFLSSQDFSSAFFVIDVPTGETVTLQMPMADVIEMTANMLMMVSARGQAIGPLPNKLEYLPVVEMIPTNVALARYTETGELEATKVVGRFGPDLAIGFVVDNKTLASLGRLATLS